MTYSEIIDDISKEQHIVVIFDPNERNIETIDMVIVNLYPFFEKVREDLSFEEKVEFIDIGGPTMLRAAAKNFQDVVVISEASDYGAVMAEIKETGDVSYKLRKKLAGKVFNLGYMGKDAVMKIIEEDGEITFNEYPRSDGGVESIRKRINLKLKEVTQKL